MNFDFGYALDQFLTIASYTGMTLKISVVTMVITVVFALAITFVRYYKIKVLTRIVNIYIDLFRGTPLLVQLFFIYFGLPQLFPSFVNMTGLHRGCDWLDLEHGGVYDRGYAWCIVLRV